MKKIELIVTQKDYNEIPGAKYAEPMCNCGGEEGCRIKGCECQQCQLLDYAIDNSWTNSVMLELSHEVYLA